MKLSTETTFTNLSGLNWNWTQLASIRAANDVVSPYVRSLIIVHQIRRREPCFFTVKFHRSPRLLAVTLNWTIIFITLISGISLSTYIKTVYWSWVTIRFSVFTKIYSWFTNHSPQNMKFTDLSRKSRKLSGRESHFKNCDPLILESWPFPMISRYERENLLQNFTPGNVFVFEISRKLQHPT